METMGQKYRNETQGRGLYGGQGGWGGSAMTLPPYFTNKVMREQKQEIDNTYIPIGLPQKYFEASS